MKVRTVSVTAQIETDQSLRDVKEMVRLALEGSAYLTVRQVQTNVMQQPRKAKKAKR